MKHLLRKSKLLISGLLISLIIGLPLMPLFGSTEITTWAELSAIREGLAGDYKLMNDLNSYTSDYDDYVNPIKNYSGVVDCVYEDMGGYTIVTWVSGDKFLFDLGEAPNSLYIDSVEYSMWDKSTDEELIVYDMIDGSGLSYTYQDSGEGWNPIAATFSGTFDGDYKIISDLYHNGVGYGDNIGLFKSVSGTIEKLGIEGAYIYAGQYVGVLAGAMTGTASECYVTGEVIADYGDGGGMFGEVYYVATISDCYARVTVTSGTNGGGFAGNIDADGENKADVSYCYSTGDVSVFSGGSGFSDGDANETGLFWDTETSGWETSDVGTGKSTAQMKTKSTFSTAGYDINGWGSIWGIEATMNNGYPILRGFYKPLWWDFNFYEENDLEGVAIYVYTDSERTDELPSSPIETNYSGVASISSSVSHVYWTAIKAGYATQEDDATADWLEEDVYFTMVASVGGGSKKMMGKSSENGLLKGMVGE
ncbi:MAG: hypothetical protein PHF74_08150 [Dehalococcoidales bacterium]|nr:hypothetical protein [Dehalococcoidales bacterium]